MPKAADPNNTFDVWLASDAAIPMPQRPVFTYRIFNGRQYAELGAFLDEIDRIRRDRQDGAFGALVKATYDALRVNLVGWRNMTIVGEPVQFDAAKLEDLLTISEAEELCQRILMKMRGLDPGEKKEPASPPCSATAAAAGAAPPAGASTPPAPSNHS